jgi:mRNA interferase MazF
MILGVKRGEVWEVNLDPTIGAEIQKIRPCIIVSRDALARLPLKIIVPLTEWNEGFLRAPWHVRVKATPENGLSKASSADTYQVRSIYEQRLIRRIGRIDESIMDRVNDCLLISLALD